MPNRSFPLTPAPIRVCDEVLDDLRRRLTATKWPLDAGNDDGYYGYGSCSSLVRHEAYCYIARKTGRDERRLSLDLMPNQSPKGRYGKIAWQKTSGRA